MSQGKLLLALSTNVLGRAGARLCSRRDPTEKGESSHGPAASAGPPFPSLRATALPTRAGGTARTAASASGLPDTHSKKGPGVRRELGKHPKRQPKRVRVFEMTSQNARLVPPPQRFPYTRLLKSSCPAAAPPQTSFPHHNGSEPQTQPGLGTPTGPHRDPKGSPQQERRPTEPRITPQPIRGSSLPNWDHKTRSACPGSARSPPAFSRGARGGSRSGIDPGWVLVTRTV